jgi:DNA sulfur modification protein DndD
MLLKKIVLENFGPYKGRVEFDLIPKPKDNKKNIILIGGKNGAGKTTFLNALRLGFYGKSCISNRISQKQYESFLFEQIHNSENILLENSYARIEIDFDHVSIGQRKNYTIERSWHLKNSQVIEYLKILTNGETEAIVQDDYWKGFIEEIIPERLSNLFFFDGEKIQEIAQEEQENTALSEAIKTLLGLDIVEKLKADLKIYKTKKLKKNPFNNFRIQWQENEYKIKELKNEIADTLELIAETKTKINGNAGDLKAWETKLHREGGHFALQRDNLKLQKKDFMEKCHELEETIRKECTDLYPFALCPSINILLKQQIEKEVNLSRQKIIKNEITSFRDEFLLEIERLKTLKEKDKSRLKQILQDLTEAKIKKKKCSSKEILKFSDSSAMEYISLVKEAENNSSEKVRNACYKFEAIYSKLRNIEKELNKSPDESQIQPIFSELALLNQRHGELNSIESQLEKKLNKKKYELKNYQRELSRLIEKQNLHGQIEDRIEKIKAIDNVLDEYYEKLKMAKIDQLSKNFSIVFNHLIGKQLVDHIKIEPKTFSVLLYDNNNSSINKKLLSSGERQLFAISMLWSLSKTSGRPLPVIIDTPLGRLDRTHRNNLINFYFPLASHQVILLSTDTEVDQTLYKELKPVLSHCYKLEYDDTTKSTNPLKGYFWE